MASPYVIAIVTLAGAKLMVAPRHIVTPTKPKKSFKSRGLEYDISGSRPLKCRSTPITTAAVLPRVPIVLAATNAGAAIPPTGKMPANKLSWPSKASADINPVIAHKIKSGGLSPLPVSRNDDCSNRQRQNGEVEHQASQRVSRIEADVSP